MTLSILAEWNNFYVIIGSSAAGLTGLTFVVIALVSDSRGVDTTGLRAFVTPTIVHFATALALAAFLNVPRQNLLSLSLGLGVTGVAGLTYSGLIAASMARVRVAKTYLPANEDWLWHVIFPTVVYGALLAMAILSWHRTEQSLYGVAAVCISLIFIGIHNAWDIAVWTSVKRKEDTK
jgi:hypothetical protein